MGQSRFLDRQDCFQKELDQLGEPFNVLNNVGNGRAGFDPLPMFKVLVLEHLHALAYAQTERRNCNRPTSLRCLHLTPENRITDKKLIYQCRACAQARGLGDQLLQTVAHVLETQICFRGKRGTTIDALVVEVSRQRNLRSEYASTMEVLRPATWADDPAKSDQKAIVARWKQKNGKNDHRYRNKFAIDVKHRFIRRFHVTSASVRGPKYVESILDRRNRSGMVYIDPAFRPDGNERLLKRERFTCPANCRGWKDRALIPRGQREKCAGLGIRVDSKHVFGQSDEGHSPNRCPRCRIGVQSHTNRVLQLIRDPTHAVGLNVCLSRWQKGRSAIDQRHVGAMS